MTINSCCVVFVTSSHKQTPRPQHVGLCRAQPNRQPVSSALMTSLPSEGCLSVSYSKQPDHKQLCYCCTGQADGATGCTFALSCAHSPCPCAGPNRLVLDRPAAAILRKMLPHILCQNTAAEQTHFPVGMLVCARQPPMEVTIVASPAPCGCAGAALVNAASSAERVCRRLCNGRLARRGGTV
jgi:hypothetical protein